MGDLPNPRKNKDEYISKEIEAIKAGLFMQNHTDPSKGRYFS